MLVFAGLQTYERDPAGNWRLADANGVRGQDLVYDPGAGVCLTVDLTGQTWTWDGTGWTLVATTGPSPRTGYGLAYDSTRQRVVLHGGASSSLVQSYFNDSWEWDGTNWTLVSNGGPTIAEHAMACDAASGRVLLYGGVIGAPGPLPGTTEVRETWSWDGLTWTQLANVGPPSSRGGMAYHLSRSRAVYVGTTGSAATPVAVWEWNGASWAQAATVNTRNAVSVRHATYDPSQSAVVVANDDVEATWDGSTWAEESFLPPSISPRTAATWDSTQGVAVFATSGSETWEWDGRRWSELPSGPNAIYPALAYDRVRATRVFVGGGPTLGTWEWSGATWARVTPIGPVPRGDVNYGATWDPVSGQVLAYHSSNSLIATAETWLWNGSAWTLASTGGPTSNINYPRLATDTKRNRVVMWTGTSLTAPSETWEWNGSVWSLMTTGGPAPRTRPALVYDAARERTLMFGGESSNDEVWEWDGARWRLLDDASYPQLASATGAFDPIAGRVIAPNGFAVIQQFDSDAIGPSCVRGTAPGATPSLTLDDARPPVGGTIAARIDGLSPTTSTVAGLIGFATFAPPIPLDAIDMIGCELQLIEVSALAMLPIAGGSSSWQLTIPNNPMLVGTRTVLQFAVTDPGANPFGLTLSNAVAAIVR